MAYSTKKLEKEKEKQMDTDTSPEQIGKDYYDALSSLTMNSRPIIESLTTLAQENTEAASEITKAVEKRINKAIPTQKLYAFYLLDSICKNVGVPYPSLFGSNIFKLFTQAYSLVDDPTRVKLIRLFKTWKIPNAVTGLALFDEDQIELVDKFLIKATACNRPPEEQRQIDISSGKATKTSILREIDDLTNLVNSRLLQMPNDAKGKERYQLLKQLRRIIGNPSPIPQKQLDFTKKQLQSIREDEVMRMDAFRKKQQLRQQQQQREQARQQQQQQQQQQQLPQFSTDQLQGLLNLRTRPDNRQMAHPEHQQGMQSQGQFNNANAQALFSMMSTLLSQGQGQPVQSRHVPAPNSVHSGNNAGNQASALGLKNLEFLKDILRKSKGQKVEDSGKHAAGNAHGSNPGGGNMNVSQNEPKAVILARFELKQNFISKHKPTASEVALIYSAKSNQCSNCSKRFATDSEGAREKALHLDWHFRTNKKLKTLSKQIHNRTWFLPEKEWEEFQEDEIVGAVDDNYELGVQMNNRVNEKKTLTEEEMNKHVVMIPDDSDNEVLCGICRDKIVGVFDDDSGEWVWRNAVKQRGRIYHYSCWIETKGQGERDRSPERR